MEQALGRVLVLPLNTSIIVPKVVIVPGGQDRDTAPQAGETGHRGQLLIGGGYPLWRRRLEPPVN